MEKYQKRALDNAKSFLKVWKQRESQLKNKLKELKNETVSVKAQLKNAKQKVSDLKNDIKRLKKNK